ncbi:MAG: hypothetical protein GC172_01100 [Phycisphaera sp.]|nr:hypothetical protein [Phycisphaera sp.]
MSTKPSPLISVGHDALTTISTSPLSALPQEFEKVKAWASASDGRAFVMTSVAVRPYLDSVPLAPLTVPPPREAPPVPFAIGAPSRRHSVWDGRHRLAAYTERHVPAIVHSQGQAAA